jgi:hypothetical protein
MKKSFSIMILTFSFIIVFFSFSINVVSGAVGNRVSAQINDHYDYFTNADSIGNTPLIWTHKLHPLLHNIRDEGGSVVNPTIELNTFLNFTVFSPDNPSVFTANPVNGSYLWDFNGLEVPEPAQLGVFAEKDDSSEIAKPGYSATRFVDPIILTEDNTAQTITVNFILEEALAPEINWFMLSIGYPVLAYGGNNLVEGFFVFQNQLGDWSEGTDGIQAWWTANPSAIEVGKTYIFQATLNAVKSTEIIGSPTFKPGVAIQYGRIINQQNITANSITITAPDNTMSVTFSAENDVDWEPAYRDYNYLIWLNPVVSQVTDPEPPGPPFYVLIPADVTIKPETLNTNSNGKFTAFVQLPEPYNVADIDVSTVTCEGALAIKGTIDEGFLVLNVKFNRQDLNEIAPGESIEFTVTGELEDGSMFEGKDSIRVNK